MSPRTSPGAPSWLRPAGASAVDARPRGPFRNERRFGLAVGTALLLLGAALALSGSRSGAAPAAAGLLIVLLATAVPRTLAPFRRAWMVVSGVLARVNTALLLGLVFFLVLTPLGAALRLAGRDELGRRRKAAGGWVPVPDADRDPRRLEKMF